jgi:hypothetical protein
LFTPSEDFWSRQANRQSHSLIQVPFGMPLGITANSPEALDAARLSAGRFSSWGEPGSARAQIRMVVRSQPTAPLPVDLPERLVYSGLKEWITVSAGEWGHGFANLTTREAYLFLSPALAAEVRLVSRYFIDHYILNFLLTEWAMLHASCVGKEDRLLVLVAPHNVGKSTTALRLLNAGYNFLADGMALLKRRPSFEGERLNNIDNGREWVVGGYPIGEVKLRDDVLALFPKYSGEAVQVREQRKTVVDLRATHPGQVVKSILRPSIIHVCLVERTSDHASHLRPLSPAEAAPTLAANTVFWDEPERLAHNTALLDRLMQTAHFHRLSIGTDTDSLMDTLEKL